MSNEAHVVGLVFGEDIAGPTPRHEEYLEYIKQGKLVQIPCQGDDPVYCWKGQKHSAYIICIFLINLDYHMPADMNWYQWLNTVKELIK